MASTRNRGKEASARAAPRETPGPAVAIARAGRRALVIALAAVVLAAIAGVALWWSQQPRATSASPAVVASAPAATYVGGKACATCHAKEAQAWRGSDHDLAMQVADAKTVLGNFDNATFGARDDATTFFTRDGKYFANAQGPDGKRADFEIKYTFGVRPLQQYLVELPGGRMQALGVAWDSRPKEAGGQRWFHLYPGRKLAPGDPLHWTGIDQNWNFQCAECHSTNLRKAFDAASGTFHTTWSEINVACEACHGPGSNHVAWAKRGAAGGDFPGKGLAIALDERRGVSWQREAGGATAKRSAPRTTGREIDVCGRCHSRAARFADDYDYAKPAGDAQRRALLGEPLYHPDGQMRDEVYDWGSFLQSRMHTQGVTCSDCHDPHSLALRAPGNAVCAQCHSPQAFDVPAHTHHASGTPGAECASCHMPTTTYMTVDPRHDHSLRIPRPDLTVKLGVPNACNACHTKKSPQWAADAVVALWGKNAAHGYQRFGEAFVAARTGAPGARGMLLTLIDDPAQPALVRASAIDRLGPWLTPTSIPAIARALNDPSPDVRAAAVGVLGATDDDTRLRYLPRMLTDDSSIVRMDAAQALAGSREGSIPAASRAAFAKAIDEYVAAQVYLADRPEGHVNLANLAAKRGNADVAIASYRKAIAIDPTFVPAYANLADLYRARGVEGEAEKVLREGLARNPQAAALHYSLGLALVRQKRMGEALPALAQAARLAPLNARYAYAYAIALNDAREPLKSLAELEAANKRHPHDREILEALALYAAHDRKQDVALGYARKLRELDPDNPQYQRMVREYEAPAAR